jgi:hypothetical protein
MMDDPTDRLTTGFHSNGDGDYADVLTSVVSLLESARRASARAVNAVITARTPQ